MPSCGAILAPSNRRAETLLRRLPPASPAPAGQLASGERVDSALRALAARYSRHSPGRVAVQTAPRSLITSPRRLPACAGMPKPRTQTLSFPSAVRYYTTKPPTVEWQNFVSYKSRRICRAGAEGRVSAQCEATANKTDATRFRRVAILPRGLTALAKCKRPRNRCRHRLFCRSFAVYSRQS